MFLLKLLPFAQSVFFEQVMGLNYQKWSSSFKTNPAFDAYNGVSHVGISANPKFFGLVLKFNDIVDRVVHLIINSYKFTFFKVKG